MTKSGGEIPAEKCFLHLFSNICHINVIHKQGQIPKTIHLFEEDNTGIIGDEFNSKGSV